MFPTMLWDSEEELNGTLQVNNTEILQLQEARSCSSIIVSISSGTVY